MGNNPRRRPGRLRLGTVPARSVQSPRAAKAGPWSQGRGGGGGGRGQGKDAGDNSPPPAASPAAPPCGRSAQLRRSENKARSGEGGAGGAALQGVEPRLP